MYISAVALILLCCLDYNSILAEDSEAPVVHLAEGTLRGTKTTCVDCSRPAFTFLNVPYARPPVGVRRFALPEPAESWEGERLAKKLGASCPQTEELFKEMTHPMITTPPSQSEDCLTLNVYSPTLKGNQPVMVYLHGGGFYSGHSGLYDGTVFAAQQEIVFVSINYRLGILGFLSFGDNDDLDSGMSANLGLHDQQMALRWIQTNIADFGGDPDQVTLAGWDAGASSVSCHILWRESWGLFHRAVSQSGSVLTLDRRPTTITINKIAGQMGCDSGGSASSLDCLRDKPLSDILDVQRSLSDGVRRIGPTFDGRELPRDPETALKHGNVSRVPYILGITSNEGYMFTRSLLPEIDNDYLDLQQAERELANLLDIVYSNAKTVADRAIQFYMGKIREATFARRRLMEIVGDALMAAPMYQTARLYADEVKDTYFYEFSHRLRVLKDQRPKWHDSADHSSDVPIIMGMPFLQSTPFLEPETTFTLQEVEMSMTLLAYWANFARTGDPNQQNLVEWKTLDDGDNFAVLKPKVFLLQRFRTDRMNFWNDKMRHLPKHHDSDDMQRDEL